jgi:hypothetical protein
VVRLKSQSVRQEKLSLVGKDFDINLSRFFGHNEDIHISYPSSDIMKQDVIGGECGVHGTEQKCMRNPMVKPERRRTL